jgi:hypothetical protein
MSFYSARQTPAKSTRLRLPRRNSGSTCSTVPSSRELSTAPPRPAIYSNRVGTLVGHRGIASPPSPPARARVRELSRSTRRDITCTGPVSRHRTDPDLPLTRLPVQGLGTSDWKCALTRALYITPRLFSLCFRFSHNVFVRNKHFTVIICGINMPDPPPRAYTPSTPATPTTSSRPRRLRPSTIAASVKRAIPKRAERAKSKRTTKQAKKTIISTLTPDDTRIHGFEDPEEEEGNADASGGEAMELDG